MKIIDPQSATLTNYEVYTHILDQKARYAARIPKRRGPGNLETVTRELLDYFRAAPSPLGCTPPPYSSRTIRTLLERLRPYDLTKAEVIMIMNHRPTQLAGLNYIIEELEQRFPEPAVQEDIVAIIAEVLGTPDGEAERKAMTDSAKDARERQMEGQASIARPTGDMDVDGS